MELEGENKRLVEENSILKRKRPGAITQTTGNGVDLSLGNGLAILGGNESHDQD